MSQGFWCYMCNTGLCIHALGGLQQGMNNQQLHDQYNSLIGAGTIVTTSGSTSITLPAAAASSHIVVGQHQKPNKKLLLLLGR